MSSHRNDTSRHHIWNSGFGTRPTPTEASQKGRGDERNTSYKKRAKDEWVQSDCQSLPNNLLAVAPSLNVFFRVCVCVCVVLLGWWWLWRHGRRECLPVQYGDMSRHAVIMKPNERVRYLKKKPSIQKTTTKKRHTHMKTVEIHWKHS